MILQQVPIEDIKRAKYNPRVQLTPADPEYKRLKKAVDKFGLVEPLVWNKRTGNLVGGHQRLSIIEARGDTTVQVSVVDLDDRDEKTLNLALNKHTGKWDEELLGSLVRELNVDGFDFDIAGFGRGELRGLMNPGITGKTDPDAIPEVPTTPITQPGDMWRLGEHRLICGDSTRPDLVDRLLRDTPAEMILTDPPYCSGGFQESGKSAGSVGTRGTEMVANDTLSTRGYIALMKAVIAQFPVGIIYAFTDWRMWINLFDVVESSGFGVRNMIVWDKQSPGMGAGWRMQHELIMCGIKVRSPFNPKKAQGNVIQCSRTGNKLHATEKPVELLVKILQVTDAAKVVADPFTGSGSTLIACETAGRKFVGMELTPHYADVAVKRWELFTGKKAKLERDVK